MAFKGVKICCWVKIWCLFFFYWNLQRNFIEWILLNKLLLALFSVRYCKGFLLFRESLWNPNLKQLSETFSWILNFFCFRKTNFGPCETDSSKCWCCLSFKLRIQVSWEINICSDQGWCKVLEHTSLNLWYSPPVWYRATSPFS